MKYAILLTALFLTACSATTEQTTQESTASSKDVSSVNIEGERLTFRGRITEDSVQSIFDAYDATAEKPQRLVISSPGGLVLPGLTLGSWVYKNKLDVEVGKLCASSCANYVLPAGKTKYLKKDSILIWHGGAWQDFWDTENEAFFDELSKRRSVETAFYNQIGVDMLITVYGQRNSQWSDSVKFFLGKYRAGWDYSLKDIEQFGVSNIVLLDDEWDWRKYRPEVSEDVNRIEVSDDYVFTLNRFTQESASVKR